MILSKKFTQYVTIKAADLEKMPFNNLTEAINVWLYGYYGSQRTYVSVIDGNLNVDVTAYSIYDIEEITLVQNAATVLNGVSPGQVLLLIKTRRHHTDKKGIIAAGQTNLVTMRNNTNSTRSNTTAYHQYYVSAYTNTDDVKAGLSANFQRDAMPLYQVASASSILQTQPYHFNRFRFNAYLDTKVDEQNTFGINAGYIPQTDNADVTYQSILLSSYIAQNFKTESKQNLWYAGINLKSNITAGLHNTFSAGIQRYHINSREYYMQSGGTSNTTAIFDTLNTVNSFYLKDDITYQAKAGKFTFTPNINFTYKRVKDSSNTSYSYGSNLNSSNSTFNITYDQKLVLLTPSLAINYADAIVLQGGFQTLLQPKPTTSATYSRLFPFASLTFNILQADKTNADLKVYGSYARSMANMSDRFGAFTDIISGSISPSGTVGYGLGVIGYTPKYDPYRTYNQFQAGTSLSLLKNKLSLSYNYNLQQFNQGYTVYITTSSGYSTITYDPDVCLNMHRAGIDVRLMQTQNFSWTSGLNFTVIKKTYDLKTASIAFIALNENISTGGFVNRFTYKHLTGAADLLYRINEDKYGYNGAITGHNNSVMLQNLYIGYQFSSTKFKNLEVFANTRNLVRNTSSSFNDNRKFYGLGFKLGL